MADLKGKRVLVTGGAGFIGSHIVELLAEEDCSEIIALSNMVRGRPENLARAIARGPVRLVDGDIRDTDLLASLVEATDIVFFHQAALPTVQPSLGLPCRSWCSRASICSSCASGTRSKRSSPRPRPRSMAWLTSFRQRRTTTRKATAPSTVRQRPSTMDGAA